MRPLSEIKQDLERLKNRIKFWEMSSSFNLNFRITL